MPLIIKDQSYLDEVIAFAKAEGLYEQPTVRLFGLQAVRRILSGYGGWGPNEGEKLYFLPVGDAREIGGGFVDVQPTAIEIDAKVARFMLRLSTDQTKEMVEKSIFADVPDPEKEKRDAMYLKSALDRFRASKQDIILGRGSFDLPKWSFNVTWARPRVVAPDLATRTIVESGGEPTMWGGLCFFEKREGRDEESVGWSVHT